MQYRVCISWSGGKDCCLALATLLDRVPDTRSDVLFVTFVPERPRFHCHPLGLLEKQGASLAARHEFVVIDPKNWRASYARALQWLRERHGTDTILTGDVFRSPDQLSDYWLAEMAKRAGIKLVAPLSFLRDSTLLDALDRYDIDARVTGVSRLFARPGLLGRRISLDLLRDTGLENEPDFDPCGEGGEYHTSVIRAGSAVFCPPGCVPAREQMLPTLSVLAWEDAWHRLNVDVVRL
jgi:diphthamide synthase (EF-2-diphthine--ammonia ligase)